MSDAAKWQKRTFWLVFVLGIVMIGVNVAYGTQGLDMSRKLRLDKAWMDERITVEIDFQNRLKRLEGGKNNAH